MNNLWSAADFGAIMPTTLPPFFGLIVIAVLQIGILIGFVMVTTLLINTIWSYKGKPYTYEQFRTSYYNWNWRRQFTYTAAQIKQMQKDDLAAMKESAKNCEKITVLLETADEDLDDNGDVVCDINKKIQEYYVGNNSAPADDSEYSLPPETQQKNLKRRQERALKRWTSTRSNYATIYKKDPIYECFVGTDTDAAAAAKAAKAAADAKARKEEADRLEQQREDTDAQVRQKLIEEIIPVASDYLDNVADPYQDLQAQIDELTAQIKLLAQGMLKKFKSLKTAYDYNNKLITDGLKSIALEEKEGFADVFDLQAQVSTLHNKVSTAVSTVNKMSATAMDFVQQNEQFKADLKQQVITSQQITSKTSELEKGKVTNNDITDSTQKHQEKSGGTQYPTIA